MNRADIRQIVGQTLNILEDEYGIEGLADLGGEEVTDDVIRKYGQRPDDLAEIIDRHFPKGAKS